MVQLVEASSLARELASDAFRLVDPRLRVRYLSGHLRNAVHVPLRKAFDADLRLLPDDRLAEWLGRSGVPSDEPVVLYDGYDGQSGAMLAWILEYLGHRDVRFLRCPFERWAAQGRELFYRPVTAEPAQFEAQPRPELRATWRDLAGAATQSNVLDTRSREEFSGEEALGDDPPGRIPGATNIPWLEFVSQGDDLFRPDAELRPLLRAAGIDPARRTIAYCRSGPRAAVAAIALQQLGLEVSLYDGSFLDWSQRQDLPIEL